MFPLLETVLELTFWNGLQLARRITLNRLDVVESLSFERHFRDYTEAVKAVQSCVSPKIAAQDSMNGLARYRGEEASHRTHASHF